MPEAVIKLKQGFGRLVRSTTDRGVISVLDSRILTKRYGKIFLQSLPEVDLFASSAAAVVERVEEFFSPADEVSEPRNNE